MAVPLLVVAASGLNLFVTIQRLSDNKVWNSDSNTFTTAGLDVPNERIDLAAGTGNRVGSYTATWACSNASADTTAGGAYYLRVHDDDDVDDKTVAGDVKHEVDGVECTPADVVKWRGATPDTLSSGLVPAETQAILTAASEAISDVVWDEPIADHNGTAGSTAEYLYNIGNEFGNVAGYVWDYAVGTAASGSYGEHIYSTLTGTIGTIDGNAASIRTSVDSYLDASISSRATPSDVANSVWNVSVLSYTGTGTFGEFIQTILPIKTMNTSVATVAAYEAIVQGGMAEMSLRTMSSEVDGDDFIVYALDGTTTLFTYTITRTPGALPVTKILV